jgi:hypothetical protein
MSRVSLRKHLDAYQSTVEEWKLDHEDAMLVFDVQDSLKMGLILLDRLNAYDENIRLLGYKGDYSSDEFGKHIEDIDGLYRRWLQTSNSFRNILDSCIEKGHSIDDADRFQAALDNVKDMLTPDDEFFSDPKLVELRDAAIDAHARGETTEWGTSD